MAHWSERVETEARRAFEVLGRLLRQALEAGNRRQVLIRDKVGKILFEVPLTYVVIGALAVFVLTRGVFFLLLLGFIAAYALGYRAVVRRSGGP